MCYTYDDLNRVTARTIKKLSDDTVISTEVFTYDLAGNVTDAPDSCFAYDTNNRLTVFNGNSVSYDLDGNMVLGGSMSCTYDSKNRLTSAGGHTYTYNAENIRIRNLCNSEDTTYTYDTNCKLSQLLCKTTNGVTTKYVYGRGLIGEEVNNVFKTYHFDSRGSTVAITDMNGNITDTFAYDTYGKQIARTGTSNIIFGYNGRDGVVTEDNGLIYMRARYYSPTMKRFINSDIVAGKITEAVTLNRYAYANANPAMFVDPSGLWGALIFGAILLGGLAIGLTSSSKREKQEPNTVSTGGTGSTSKSNTQSTNRAKMYTREEAEKAALSGEDVPSDRIINNRGNSYSSDGHMIAPNPSTNNTTTNNVTVEDPDNLEQIYITAKQKAVEEAIDTTIDWGAQQLDDYTKFSRLINPSKTPPSVYIKGASTAISAGAVLYDAFSGIVNNYESGASAQKIIGDATVDLALGLTSILITTAIGCYFGPYGAIAGFVVGLAFTICTEVITDPDGKTYEEQLKDSIPAN